MIGDCAGVRECLRGGGVGEGERGCDRTLCWGEGVLDGGRESEAVIRDCAGVREFLMGGGGSGAVIGDCAGVRECLMGGGGE